MLKEGKAFLPVIILLVLSATSLYSCTRAPATATPAASPAPGDPFVVTARLGRAVNLGNALEAPREGEWGVVLSEEYFQLIKDAGLSGVRIPIRWSAHAATRAPYTIDPSFFARVDWAVDQALSRGLVVIVNMHHYEEIFREPAAHRERFLALWAQIAEHYKAYPADLLFEPLNEPNGALTSAVWNRLLKDAIATIRQTNPERNIVAGPANWNGIGYLSTLDLPAADRHIIVTVHYYEPFRFTHQGAEWVSGAGAWLGTTWRGTEAEKGAIRRDLDLAAGWGRAHNRPVFLGEFGAYSKAEMAHRALWTATVAREAEKRGMSWAYWEFCAGFGVYDPARGQWNKLLLEALVPPAP